MSEREQRAFFGEDGRPSLYEVIATLRALTGCDACANELVAAADEVERLCGPGAALTEMPHWIN